MVLQKLQAPKINNLLFKLPFQQFSNETWNTSPGITFERWNNLSNKYFALYTANSGIAAAFFQMIEMPFRFVSLPPFLMKKVRVVACHVLNNFHAERERERDLKVNPEFEKMTAVLSNAICYYGSLPTAGECQKNGIAYYNQK